METGLPKYMVSDTQRKCPSCGRSDNWRRSRTYSKVTTCVDGKIVVEWVRTDAANYQCLDCKYEAST